MIPKFLKKFYEKHNLRPVECTWLIYVHILGFFGLVTALYNYHILHKVFYLMIQLFLIHCVFHLFYGLGITAGAHRLWAHKSYHASKPLKILLMLFNCGTNQGSIFHWSRDHRLHHKYSDTPLDPHNINQGFFYSHVGWLLVKKTPELIEEGKRIEMSDLKNDKVVMFQKKHYLPLSVLMCFVLPSKRFNYLSIILLFINRYLIDSLLLFIDVKLLLHTERYLVCEFSLSYVRKQAMEQKY